MTYTIYPILAIIAASIIFLLGLFIPRLSKIIRYIICIVSIICICAAIILPPYLELQAAKSQNEQIQQKMQLLDKNNNG